MRRNQLLLIPYECYVGILILNTVANHAICWY